MKPRTTKSTATSMYTELHAGPPSSETAGFFQEPPHLQDAFSEDEALRRVYKFYLPADVQSAVSDDLTRFSHLVLSRQVLAWCADAERNPPSLRTWDSWGRRIDELNTSEGWRRLQDLGIAEGIVALGHDGKFAQFARVYQFLKYHIWSPSSAFVTCPSAMTDGAATLLHAHLANGGLDGAQMKVFDDAYRSLVSRDPKIAKTSGQWMTERVGGSDVRQTETQATLVSQASHSDKMRDAGGAPLGPYSISGFKWFSSATDAAMTVLLAKEPSGAVSAFFAPLRRQAQSPTSERASDTVMNGITIQKLKAKLGSRALPTAELSLSDMRAWPVGRAGNGTKEISTILNITRVHNAVTAVGFWGRGLAVSRAFSRVRKARGRLLMDTPAHVRTLAEQHVQYRAMMHLSFFTTALLGVCENMATSPLRSSPPSPNIAAAQSMATASLDLKTAPQLLRILTPLSKMLTAKAAIAGLAECMESLGGVGYLENDDVTMNIARLYRDANVLSIWEGTTNVLADDLIRVVKGSSGAVVLDALEKLNAAAAEHWQSSDRAEWADALSRKWQELRVRVEETSSEELAVDGRVLGRDLGWIICAVLLGEDALSDGNPAATEVCARWMSQAQRDGDAGGRTWTDLVRADRMLVFGDTGRLKTRL